MDESKLNAYRNISEEERERIQAYNEAEAERFFQSLLGLEDAEISSRIQEQNLDLQKLLSNTKYALNKYKSCFSNWGEILTIEISSDLETRVRPIVKVLLEYLEIIRDLKGSRIATDSKSYFKDPIMISDVLTLSLTGLAKFESLDLMVDVVALIYALMYVKCSGGTMYCFEPSMSAMVFKDKFLDLDLKFYKSADVTGRSVLDRIFYLLNSNLPTQVGFNIYHILKSIDKTFLYRYLSSVGFHLLLQPAKAMLIRCLMTTVNTPFPDLLKLDIGFFALADEAVKKGNILISSTTIHPIYNSNLTHVAMSVYIGLMNTFNKLLEIGAYDKLTFEDKSILCELALYAIRTHVQCQGNYLLELNCEFIAQAIPETLKPLTHCFSDTKRKPSDAKVLHSLRVDYSNLLLNYSMFILGLLQLNDRYSTMLNGSSSGSSYLRLTMIAYFNLILTVFNKSFDNLVSINPHSKLTMLEIATVGLHFTIGYIPFAYDGPEADLSYRSTLLYKFYSKLKLPDLHGVLPTNVSTLQTRLPTCNVSAHLCHRLITDTTTSSIMSKKIFNKGETTMYVLMYYDLLPVCAAYIQEPKTVNIRYLIELFWELAIREDVVKVTLDQHFHTIVDVLNPMTNIFFSMLSDTGPYSKHFRTKLLNSKTLVVVFTGIVLRKWVEYDWFYNNDLDSDLISRFNEITLLSGDLDHESVKGFICCMKVYDTMFKNDSINYKFLEYNTAAHLVVLFGHGFMLYGGHPSIDSDTSFDQAGDLELQLTQKLARFEKFSNYGSDILKTLVILVKRVIENPQWYNLLVNCGPKYDFVTTLPPRGHKLIDKLICIPSSHIPTVDRPIDQSADEFSLSVLKVLFHIIMSWSAIGTTAMHASNIFLDLINKTRTCRRYVLTYSNFISRFAFEITKSYYKDASVNNALHAILAKLLTDLDHLRITLLKDRFGDWFRSILKFPDYATRSKLTEPTKLTSSMLRELTNNFSAIHAIFINAQQDPTSRLAEFAAVGLIYCGYDSRQNAALTGFDKPIESVLRTTDWSSSAAPFKYVVQMLIGKYQPTQSELLSLTGAEIQTQKNLNEARNKAAAYAINFLAFLKTTPMRRRMKILLKEAIADQVRLLKEYNQLYLDEMTNGNIEEITLVPDNLDSANGDMITVPKCLLTAVSTTFDEMFTLINDDPTSNDNFDPDTNTLTLPSDTFNSVSYFAIRLKAGLLRRSYTNSENEYNIMGDIPKLRQPQRLRLLFDLANNYHIDYLKRYCYGTFIRHLFVATRSVAPALLLNNLYTLFSGDQFLLLQPYPDLCQFLSHLIALHLPEFFTKPELPSYLNQNSNTSLNNPNGEVNNSSDLEDVDLEESEFQDDDDNDLVNPDKEKDSLLINSLDPNLLAKFWAAAYLS